MGKAKKETEKETESAEESNETAMMVRTGGMGTSSHPGFKRSEVISVDKYNVQKSAVKSVFRGRYLLEYEGKEFADKDTGEVTRLTFYMFEYLPGDGVGRWRCTADEGLRQSLFDDGQIKPGDAVEFVKLGKVPMGDGKKTINTYKVFRLEEISEQE